MSTHFDEVSGRAADELSAASRHFVKPLPDGFIFPVAGRDLVPNTNPPQYTPWEYGLAIKHRGRVTLLFAETTENWLVDGVDFARLVRVLSPVKPTNAAASLLASVGMPLVCAQEGLDLLRKVSPPSPSSLDATRHAARRDTLIILAHGFCPEDGPDYPLMSAIRLALETAGFDVVAPDFRRTYEYDSGRGRSERVSILMEELLVAVTAEGGGYGKTVLVGHSQGGAAVGQLCASERVVRSGRVHGVAMIGSESPVERLSGRDGVLKVCESPIIHLDRPAGLSSEALLLLHAERDTIVSPLHITQLGEQWDVPVHVLSSKVEPDQPEACWADEVQHDFMALDLLTGLMPVLFEFVDRVIGNGHIEEPKPARAETQYDCEL